MKIAIIGTAYPYRGGLAAFNERLAKQFMAEGHEVKIFTFTLQYPSFLFPGKTQFSDGDAPNDLIIKRQINSVNPLNWILAGKKIRKEGFDVAVFCYWLSFMSPCFGTIARILGKNIKKIALVHNMLPHERTLLDRLLPRYFVRSMDGFVAMSDSVLADIRQLEKAHTPKIANPHPLYDHFGESVSRDEALAKLGLSPDYRYILFFGLVRAYKGLDLLLEAFADEHLRKFPVRLLVVGEFYEPEQKYTQIIDNKGIAEFIAIHNEYVPDEAVRLWFSVADLVVQPYRDATQSGISQIAYHFEKPMLVTDVGGLAEIVPNGKAGYVVQPNVNEIAIALTDFFENNRKEKLENGVREEKKRFLWSGMTAAIFELINKK